MKFSSLTSFVVLCALFFGIFLISTPPLFSGQDKINSSQDLPKFKAYYFYTSKRCGPCRRIEKWSQEAIENGFQKEIGTGELQWQAINVELPENKHFIQDFKLYTKSVVIVELKENSPIRWDILENVWLLHGNRDKFVKYVVDSTRQFMEKS